MFVWAMVQCAVASASAATPLLVLDGVDLRGIHRVLAASLQGNANRTPEAPRCFMLNEQANDETWLALWGAAALSQPAQTVTLDELLAGRVKPYLKGQVLYNPRRILHAGCSEHGGGNSGAAVTDKDLGLNTLYDFRTKWNSAEEAYSWMAETLPSGKRTTINWRCCRRIVPCGITRWGRR